MRIESPTIVLFDMDGTTVRHVSPRLLGLLEFLDDMSFRLGNLFRRQKIADIQPGPPKKSPSLLVHRALHKVRKKSVEQIVQPCPGIYMVLNMLKDKDIPMGIVSNGLGKGYGYDILEKFNLKSYFVSRTFREDIHKSKPHPEPIIRALKKIREPLLETDVVWYIGDRHKDIIAALAANDKIPAKVIPFAYGLNASIEVLKKGLGTDHIIVNYTDFAGRIRDNLA